MLGFLYSKVLRTQLTGEGTTPRRLQLSRATVARKSSRPQRTLVRRDSCGTMCSGGISQRLNSSDPLALCACMAYNGICYSR